MAALAVMAVAVATPATQASPPPGRAAAVVVQAPGAEGAAAAAVARLGGRVTRMLPIVSGFAATVPAGAVGRLRGVSGVRAVTPDEQVVPASFESSSNLQTVNSVFTRAIGADVLAGQGYTGAGVRVALIDTGVSSEVATRGDLAGRVVRVPDPDFQPTPLQPHPPLVECVDFSGEDTCDDTFGHGTFMAGLIAGDGAASGGRYAGVAPRAEIVSIKVGGADGSADVSKVLAGIQWAVSFADEYGIRVLNLSLGTDSRVSPEIDPLNLAVQRAWVSGITVVVAAGNFGRGAPESPYGTITKPGDDPFVVTVAAVDDRETPAMSDDRLPAFSSWGPTRYGVENPGVPGVAKPDVVAPGGRVVSLRAAGSTIESLPGVLPGTPYRRGSGTSMATAITSGLAALLLDARDGTDGRPAWRPDDVKAALIAGAQKVAVADSRAVGAGLVNGPAALAAAIAPVYRVSVLSDGSGSLDDSRGSNRVRSPSCDPVSPGLGLTPVTEGDRTAQCNAWDGDGYATGAWTPQSWYESQWVTGMSGRNWQTSTWAESSQWQGRNWQGSSWQGQTDNQSYGTPIPGSGSYGAWG